MQRFLCLRLCLAPQVNAAFSAAERELRELGDSVEDEAALNQQLARWMSQLVTSFGAVEESRVHKLDGIAHAAGSVLEVNRHIETASQAWFSQVPALACSPVLVHAVLHARLSGAEPGSRHALQT